MGVMRTEELLLAIFSKNIRQHLKSGSSDQILPERATSRFMKKKLPPSIIANFPHVWSDQYWGTPNGVPQKDSIIYVPGPQIQILCMNT